MRLQLDLGGIPMRTGCWPVRRRRRGKLERVTLSTGQTYECDYLACGFGLVPNLELAQMLGCEIEEGFVATVRLQETSVAGVYCAGEPTGIGGLDRSLLQGEIAGYAARVRSDRARRLYRGARPAGAVFSHALGECFGLRDELRSLATPDTIVCRCEDVTLGAHPRRVGLDSGEASDALRHGAVPGTHLRRCARVHRGLPAQLGSSAGVSGEHGRAGRENAKCVMFRCEPRG